MPYSISYLLAEKMRGAVKSVFHFPSLITGLRQNAAKSSATIKHQMTGSQKMTAIYWNFGIRKATNSILPNNSITLDKTGSIF